MELGTNAIPEREDINPLFIDKVLEAIVDLEEGTDLFVSGNVSIILEEIQKILVGSGIHKSNATLVDIHYVLEHKEHYRRENAAKIDAPAEQLELELVGEA
jgi:hypothetical protein